MLFGAYRGQLLFAVESLAMIPKWGANSHPGDHNGLVCFRRPQLQSATYGDLSAARDLKGRRFWTAALEYEHKCPNRIPTSRQGTLPSRGDTDIRVSSS
jgi:hypothetical protein